VFKSKFLHIKKRKLTFEAFVSCFFLFFVFFPYFQIVKSNSYNQPYALFFSILLIIINKGFISYLLKKKKILVLLSPILIGTFLFIINCFPYNNLIEYKYLIVYFSITLITIATVIVALKHLELIRRMTIFAFYAWSLTSLIQYFFDPSFLMVHFQAGEEFEALDANILLDSGRGILGFAPEPTHHGFHMLLIAFTLVLLEEKWWMILWCILQSLFLAKSSSALLTVVLGILLSLVFLNLSMKKLYFIFFLIFFGIIGHTYIQNFDISGTNSRMLSLIYYALMNPEDAITFDASMNSRLGGMYATIALVFSDLFMPHGLSQDSWMFYHDMLMKKFNWLNYLSETQAPSGLFSLLFQSGWLMIPSLYLLFKSVMMLKLSHNVNWLKYTFFLIALSQFSLGTPIFCLIFGLVFSKFYNKEIKCCMRN